MAGRNGSTDGAGTIMGLNYLFEALDNKEMNELCASLGSDLNVCLNGGCSLATSRGEVTKKLPSAEYPVTLIKPNHRQAPPKTKQMGLRPFPQQRLGVFYISPVHSHITIV